MEAIESSIFRQVPKTGVIYVMSEAAERGFHDNRSEWSNLGQGAPEIGMISGCPDRVTNIPVSPESHEYAPVGGLDSLKDAVAQLYNARYRSGHKHKFSAENVAISSGGRLALTRVVATLGNSNVGHFLPDYTAYEELLGSFGTFIPIPIPIHSNSHFSGEVLEREIIEKGLSTILLSNPSNPSGIVLSGEILNGWVSICRKLHCAAIYDEFYSHYVYGLPSPWNSAAEYIENINSENTVILDGLTKNWRYPGFRISWTLGPKSLIERIDSAASFLDGGPSHPTQELTVSLLEQKIADQEARAINSVFSTKRDYLHSELNALGITCELPAGSFYCWGDLSQLPESINTGSKLFEVAIEKNLIIVPGAFFDINPGRRRPDRSSQFESFARFSFGPKMEELKLGISILKQIIGEHS